MRVLITSGPTREPIDDVRYVSNVSTGRLGVAAAAAFLAAGWEVSFLRGAGSLAPPTHPALTVDEFTSTESLLALLTASFEPGQDRPVAWIHAAAVADYAPVKVDGKIQSHHDVLRIEMQPTPKVADAVRRECPDVAFVMFKLESGIRRDELHDRARRTMKRASADAIVANLLEDVSATAHRADLLRKDGSTTSFDSRDALAAGLVAEAERLLQSSTRALESLE